MATQLGQAVLHLVTDDSALRQGIDRSKLQAQQLDRTFNTATGNIERNFATRSRAIIGHIGRIGAAMGITFGLSSLAVIGRMASQLDEVAKSADRVGVSVEGLQELRLAAELAGVESRTLDMALQRFSRRVGEAAQGTGELKGTLDQYNISVRDSVGQMRSQEDILNDVADAIQNAESDQERLRIAFKAFDSEGARLVELLRNGSAGLEQMRRQARETGSVVKEETVRGMVELNDKITILVANLKGALAPALNAVVSALVSLTDAIGGLKVWAKSTALSLTSTNTLRS